MRFPHPVAVACVVCGQPTVVAETSTGFVRVHCGTWRWQCDKPTGTARHRPATRNPAAPDPEGDQLAA